MPICGIAGASDKFHFPDVCQQISRETKKKTKFFMFLEWNSKRQVVDGNA